MATPARSRPRQSGLSSENRQSHAPTALPPYQSPSYPLNDAAQRALRSLPQTHNLAILKDSIRTATTSLTNVVGDANDRYQWKAAGFDKRNARRAAQGLEEEADDAVAKLREDVASVTQKIEETVRKMIDGEAAVERLEAALAEVSTNVTAGGGQIAPTQSTLGASQFRQQRRERTRTANAGSGEESEFDEDVDHHPEAGGQENVGPSAMLKRKLGEQETQYQDLSMSARYATNNSYIGFKRIVHDTANPGENAPPMPHASTWFPNDPSSQTNSQTQTTRGLANHQSAVTAANNVDNEASDDDDDIEVASERISIKCPLTLLPMKVPLTSRKCPHSFEKEAILDMINHSTLHVGGNGRRGLQGGGQKAMKCPVCEVLLTTSDLHTDPVLIRKIARINAAAQHPHNYNSSDEDSDSDNDRHRPSQNQDIDSGEDISRLEADSTARARARASLAPRVKAERMGSSARQAEIEVVPGTQIDGEGGEQPPPSSTAEIVDLQGGDEDEDEEEEEEEEDEEE